VVVLARSQGAGLEPGRGDPSDYPPDCQAPLSYRRRNAGSVTVGQEADRWSGAPHPRTLRVGGRLRLADSLNGLRPLALPVGTGLPRPRNGRWLR
jgi:hypothetical protein